MDKVICVGKNYLDHAKELGDVIPEKPVLFLKPPSIICYASEQQTKLVKLPKSKSSVHFECELAFKVDRDRKLSHFTLGLDMTLRELQAQLKKNGHPWEVAKVFYGSIILGPWCSLVDHPNLMNHEFTFSINDQKKQSAQGSHMRMTPQECLEYASEYFPINEGDVLMSGTPSGVGEVKSGDRGRASIKGIIDYLIEWS